MRKPLNIGIFGGSFNPIHIGHLIIANFFVSETNLDVCLFVPNSTSPFKFYNKDVADAQHRIKMIALAIKGNPKFKIETYEIDQGGISYSFDTVLFFQNKFPQSSLHFLIGSDQAKKFIHWKNWQTILKYSKLVVARRSFEKVEYDFVPFEFQNRIILLDNPVIEVSATQIRELIRNRKSIDYLVPNNVKKYIFENKLYLDS